MDKNTLKTLMDGKLNAHANFADVEFDFNQKYAGAQFDLTKLTSFSWKELQRDETSNGVWLERILKLDDGKLIEFRVYFSTLGHWRDADILVFDSGNKPGNVRIPTKSLSEENIKSVSNELDSAKSTDYPTDIGREIECITWMIDMSKIPPDTTETEYRLSMWRNSLSEKRESDPGIACRIVSGITRYGHFCKSGLTLVNAAFNAFDIGMEKESAMLFGYALEEDSDNTAEYWNLLGCVMHRFKFLNEAFECFSTAHEMLPDNKIYCNNIWIAGRLLMPEKLIEQDFLEIVRDLQIMLKCAEGISTGEKAKFLCALGLGYEGKGDLDEAAIYYSLAMKTVELKDKDGKNDGEDKSDFKAALCPMAIFGLHRLKDTDVKRRMEAFNAQVKTFPLTPYEAGWLGKAPVKYVEGIPHGSHWGAVIENVEDLLVKHIGEIIREGKVEGAAEYPPAEIAYCDFEKAAAIEYPHEIKGEKQFLKAFVVNGKQLGVDSLEVCSAFPVFGSGVHVEMAMNYVIEWLNGLEANVCMDLNKKRTLEFFVPDYYRDRNLFKKDFNYMVELAGFAYCLEQFKETHFDVDRGPMLEAHKEMLKKEGKPFDIKSVPVFIKEDASYLNPRMGSDDEADCEFLGKVVDVTMSKFFGNTVYRVVVRLHEESCNGLELPVFIGKHNLKGFTPEVGMAVTGVLWLQGILRKEIGKAEVVKEENEDIGERNFGNISWFKDGEFAPTEEAILASALVNSLGSCPMSEIRWRLDRDPRVVVRTKDKNLFIHLTKDKVKDEEDLKEKMKTVGANVLEYNLNKGIQVEQVGIGLINQGQGYKILYVGFDELEEKYGKKCKENEK